MRTRVSGLGLARSAGNRVVRDRTDAGPLASETPAVRGAPRERRPTHSRPTAVALLAAANLLVKALPPPRTAAP